MARMADAIYWWRLMLTELGGTAHTAEPGLPGKFSKEQTGAVVNLLISIIDAAAIPNMLEIGAHSAEISKRFVKMPTSAAAHAYEASPRVYSRFAAEPFPPKLKYIHAAVGRSAGQVEFYVPVEERLQLWGSTRKRIGDVATEKVSVPMITLDDAAKRLPPVERRGSGRDLALWIDVEGSGHEVIGSGLQAMRDRVAAVYIEMYDFEPYEGAAKSLELLTQFLDLGFVPVARDNQFRDAWNLLLVHEEIYSEARIPIFRWMYKHAGFARNEERFIAALERSV